MPLLTCTLVAPGRHRYFSGYFLGMFTRLKISSLIVIIFFLASCAPLSFWNRGDDFQRERRLWRKTVEPYLQLPLWRTGSIYDAGHFLMIPLHAAFQLGESSWQQEFARHFEKFVEVYPREVAAGRLNRLQYFYLLSRFMVLAGQAGRPELVPPALPDIVQGELERLWSGEPAWQWGRPPFPGGMRERLSWKLEQKATRRSYYRAIIDEELYVFAIAADYCSYRGLEGEPVPAFINEVLDVAYEVFQQRAAWLPDGGWLFQPGVWDDYPDYAYAGCLKKKKGLQPSPVHGVATDSSHSHRFPLWLSSLAAADSSSAGRRKGYYLELRRGLAKQFFLKVLLPPTADFSAFRLTNYMDGSNGIFRWNYPTQGEGRGYGPGELSGTLLLGWWTFLQIPEIRDVYRDIARQFPLPATVVALYLGPDTSRQREPLVKGENPYRNGFYELICRLAGALPRQDDGKTALYRQSRQPESLPGLDD